MSTITPTRPSTGTTTGRRPWLADGWLIGGGFEDEELSGDYPDDTDASQIFQFLHDPLPTEDVYRTLTSAEQKRYWNYRASAEKALRESGLRCVITLGRPRRP